MDYHKTKNILYIMQLEHKNIKKHPQTYSTTESRKRQYTCRTARDLKEATKLTEAGFEYVIEIEGCKLFTRGKWVFVHPYGVVV